MKQLKAFVLNTALLTATSLLMRTIGVWFGAYLSGKIGAAGIGLYQLIMSVYTLSVTLATSGIHLAATRLVAEELGRNNPSGAKKAMHRCLLYSAFFGVLAALLLLQNAQSIGTVWLGDVRTVLSLRLLAVSLPFIALSSALGGYFTAVRRVYKSAVTQVLEQAARIALTIFGLTLLLPKGLEYACLAIVGGGSLAELSSFFILYLFYLLDSRRYRLQKQKESGLTRRLLGISLPVAFSAYARSGLVTIEQLLIPRGLRKAGASSEAALAAYGTLHGMVLPVVLFPAAFLQALAGLLIPELAECRARCNEVRINYITGRVFQLALLFSIGVAGILYSFSGDISLAIYKNLDTARYIRILAPLVPVMYLDTAVDGMLKGLGEQVSSMRYNIIDAFCSVVLVSVLVPRFALAGYLATIFFTELLNATLSVRRLITITQPRLDLFGSLVGPVFGIAGACAMAKLLLRLGGLPLSYLAAAAVQILLALFFYLLFLTLSACVTGEDIRWSLRILR